MGPATRSMLTALLLLCGVIGWTNSQDNVPTAEEVRDQLAGVVPELGSLNTSAIPSVEEVKNLFKQKCEKNGGVGAFERATAAQEDMQNCITSLVNVTEFQAEMEKYKLSGDLDIVFRNYCRKSPVLKKCVTNFTTAIEPCLEPKERENKRIVLNITDSLLGFVCFKEGDRIALFISAGGPECLNDQRQGIQDCVNATFGGYVPPSGPNSMPGVEQLPSLVFAAKECTDLASLQSCIVRELEKCPDPTPANIVDSIFTFVLRVTPCRNFINANEVQSAAPGLHYISSVGIAALVLLLRLL